MYWGDYIGIGRGMVSTLERGSNLLTHAKSLGRTDILDERRWEALLEAAIMDKRRKLEYL